MSVEAADRLAHTASLPAPIKTGDFGREATALLASSAVAAVALVWILFDQVTLLNGALGFLVCAYVAWLILYWSASAMVEGSIQAKERVVTLVMWSAAAVLFTPLLIILYFVISHGWRTLRAEFFLTDSRLAGPLTPVNKVGGLHAILGTLEQNGLALLIGVPAAVLTALFLNEVGGRFTRSVRTIVTAMSGIPSIVAGLFVFAFFVSGLNQHFSGFAGALALTIILLPMVTRTTEEVLRLVPGGLRESSAALGAPEWRTSWSVVLPTAKSGIMTAVLLGLALTVGETAPLLYTAFGASQTNTNPFAGPQAALPLVAFQDVTSPIPAERAVGYTCLLVLMMLVLVLFILARIVGRTGRRRRPIRALYRRIEATFGKRGAR